MSRRLLAALLTIAAVLVPAAPSEARPLKVFILAGQSNMQGHAEARTLDAMRLDPELDRLRRLVVNRDGTPRTSERTWVSAIGSSDGEKVGPLTVGFGPPGRDEKLGPELGFGFTVERRLREPILVIKTAWGGKSLHTDFRPPSAGPSEFTAQQLASFERQERDVAALKRERAEATGRFYRLMMEHVKRVLADPGRVHPDYDPDEGYELAGFVWFQGWNDMVDGGQYPDRGRPGGYDAYSEVMAHFIRDVRRDLEAPELPFVIGVLGVGGPIEQYRPDQQRYAATHRHFRDAMAAPASMPEFAGTVAAVRTEAFWDMELEDLRYREREHRARYDAIEARRTAGELTRPEAEAARVALDRELFRPREITLLRESTSNQAYHYLGSARILVPIGHAFARSMLELRGESR